jgi:hypothetical protein
MRFLPNDCGLVGRYFVRSAFWKQSAIIACDKREAFAHGSEATKQAMPPRAERWIASLAMTGATKKPPKELFRICDEDGDQWALAQTFFLVK